MNYAKATPFILIIAAVILLAAAGCTSGDQPVDLPVDENQLEENGESDSEPDSRDPGRKNGNSADGGTPGQEGDDPETVTVQAVARGGGYFFSFETWRELAELAGWELEWNPVDRKLRMTGGGASAELIDGVPVMEKNGLFHPLSAAPEFEDERRLIPTDAWELLSDQPAAPSSPEGGSRVEISVSIDRDEPPAAPDRPEIPQEPDEAVRYLDFLTIPIEGAATGLLDFHLPGAARDYRLGTHEGFDWYEYVIGVDVDRHTPILSMGDGTVIRADHGWETPTAAERGEWLDASLEAGRTPEWALDRFRGRQIWIMHENGVMVRYAHLESVAAGIDVGTSVSAGEVIGTVGNSGTQSEVLGTDEGLHLHSDILVYGQNIWLDFDAETIRHILSHIFSEPE